MNKLKEFAKEHKDEIIGGIIVTGLCAVYAVAGYVVRGHVDTYKRAKWLDEHGVIYPKELGNTLGAFGKVGEAIIEKNPDLTAESKVYKWSVFTD